MKTQLAISLFLVGAVLAPVPGHAEDSDADRTRPMVFVKDSVITSKIKARLAMEKLSSMAQIKVDTDDKGAVELSGFARTQDLADKAVAIAKETKGVTSVHSTIAIRKDD